MGLYTITCYIEVGIVDEGPLGLRILLMLRWPTIKHLAFRRRRYSKSENLVVNPELCEDNVDALLSLDAGIGPKKESWNGGSSSFSSSRLSAGQRFMPHSHTLGTKKEK